MTACGGGPDISPASAPATDVSAVASGTTQVASGTTQDAMNYMAQGNGETARQILNGILAEEPDNRIARSLLEQIEADPRTLLGAESYAYTVRRGDTLSSIAQNRLGDASLFYVLARYNGIADPRRIAAGQSLRIPGTPPAQAPPAPSAPPARQSRNAAPAASTRTPAQPAASRPATNPARARTLRRQGLAALNRGSVSRAVSLFSQASRLDPDNAAIQADLARARRIQRTLNQ